MSIANRTGGVIVVSPLMPIPRPNMWLDSSRMLGLSDGNAVTDWYDISGNGNHATQATANNKPTYKTGIINSLPAILFQADAYGKSLNIPLNLIRNVSGASIFIVSRILAESGGNNRRFFQICINASTYSKLTALRPAADESKLDITGRTLDADVGTDYLSSTGILANDTNHVITVLADFAGAYIYGYNNGSLVASGALASAGTTNDTDAYAAAIGSNVGPETTGTLEGHIAEFILYKRTVTSTERAQIEAYLMTKYAIT